VVLGWWLDVMISEVFSNLNDSMTLRCLQSAQAGSGAGTRLGVGGQQAGGTPAAVHGGL